MKLEAILCSAFLLTGSVLPAMEMKSPDVPFAKTGVTAVEAKSIFKDNSIVCGSKTLLWPHDYNNLKLLNNEQMVFGIQSRVIPSAPGWAPFVKFQTTIDREKQSVIRTHDFMLTKDAGGTFRQTIALLPDGKAEITTEYDAGANLSLLKNQAFRFYFPLHAIQGKKIQYTDNNGRIKNLDLPGKEKWGDGQEKFWINTDCTRSIRKMVFAPDSPEESFTIEFPDTIIKHIVIFRSPEGAYFHPTFNELGKPFKMVIDFGKSNAVSAQDNIVNGINFTKNNGYEVTVFDEKKNMFINPSFESGARYFHDHNGGFNVQDMIYAKDARSGKFSLLLNRSAKAFNFPTLANQDYTISFYAKSPDGKPHRVNVEADHYFWSGDKPRQRFEVSENEWKRYEMTFRWPNSSVALNFSGDGALIDDLQFEPGKNASEYRGNSLGIELLTDSPEKYYAEEGKKINARLVVRGPIGTAGKISVNITDFFNRKPYTAVLNFKLPESGEAILTLAPDSVFTDGVNRIRLRVEPEGLPAYTDFLRLSRFKYADGTSKNKNLHAIAGIGWPGKSQLLLPDSVFNMMKRCGIGSVAYGGLAGSYNGSFTPELSKSISERWRNFGFEVWTAVLNRIYYKPKKQYVYAMGDEPMVWDGVLIKEMEFYSPEVLSKVEEFSYQLARKYPWIKFWNAPTEPGVAFQSLKKHRIEEYAKLILAMNHGLTRGNPEALFSPYGVCNMSDVGRKEIYAFLEAARKVDPSVKFKTIDAHPYRGFTELPDTEADFVELLNGLEKIGYGDIQVRWLEGAYFYPLIVSQWQGIAPWQNVQTKDGYFSQHVPSYDLGWGERVATALLMRHWLVAYKYQDRLKMACTWVPRFLDGSNPFALFVMSAAMTDILGDSSFQKDVRFAPGARAYIFEDGKKRPVAAVWKFEEELDRGLKKGSEMTLDLKGTTPEFIDLMGNICKVQEKNGKYTVPLTNFPFYVRVKPRELDALISAVSLSQVSDSERLPIELSARSVSVENIQIKAVNPLSREIRAEISINGAPMREASFKPLESKAFQADLPKPVTFNSFTDLSIPVVMKYEGKSVKTDFKMNVLPVKYVKSGFDWNTIPAVPIAHVHMEFESVQKGIKWGGPQDLSGVCRMAWNEDNLFLRFEVTDDKFVLNLDKKDPGAWYNNDSIQLFFDTFGDARENAQRGRIGFDHNDYSYELLPTSSDTCIVYRRHVPDHQFTGGVDGGLKANVIETGIKCEFLQEGNKLIYTVTFPARYLMPMQLEPGRTPGIGIKIYDRDDMKGYAKQHLSNIPAGAGDAFQRPDLYTQLLLVK